jgi:hypothetical protein
MGYTRSSLDGPFENEERWVEEEEKKRWMAMLHVLQRITLTYLIIIVPRVSLIAGR